MASLALCPWCVFFELFLLLSVVAANQYNPQPNPKSVVTVKSARFTILTSRLIRMEWGQALDAATFTFINRNLVTPRFNVSSVGNKIIIKTDEITVQYLPDGNSFNEKNLQVSLVLNGKTKMWSPRPTGNATLEGNLLGTIRTLDGENGFRELNCLNDYDPGQHCTLGLVSTEGYVVVDDTGHPQFDDSTWPWVVNQSFPQPSPDSCKAIPQQQRRDCGYPGISDFDCIGKGCCLESSARRKGVIEGIPFCYYGQSSKQDLYFFGHGHDYKGALREFTMVAGKIPLPPRHAFGIFYSRYWAYDDIGQMNIIEEYRSRRIPLDVMVTDMDWHQTFYAESVVDQAGQRKGWTGFTWDKHLFPDPNGFLDWCKRNKIRNTLNLHPASGIQPWEERYPEMATAMGIDPSTQKYVKFDPTDIQFANNFFKLILQPLEEEGVDFWWLDWQQGESFIKIPLVNPTFWLNHIFSTNPYHWNVTSPVRRPLILHRWGGLGNHRYQVGFSGDVFPSWDSLDYQVNFTLKATNVLFGYWSHDLGGHLESSPPELYTRWVQWGTFSPMFRTHCTKNANNDRRIWTYPLVNYKIMRDAMILRAAMIPYIYTHARSAHDTGLSLLRPMYYEYPEADESYMYDRQYYFGPDILVAPITQPVNNQTGLALKEMWIPEGTYISWFSGEMVKGPKVISRSYTLSEIPVFVKAGSIIPMRTDGYNNEPLGTASGSPSSIKFMIFVGDAETGSGYLYDDDGETINYMDKAEYGNTTVKYTHSAESYSMSIVIDSVKQYQGVTERQYQLVIPNFWPASQVVVDLSIVRYCYLQSSFDDYEVDCWTYDGSSLSLIINIASMKPTDRPVTVDISYADYKAFNPYWYPGYTALLKRLTDAKNLLDDQWGIDTVYQEKYFGLLNATEMGRVLTYSSDKIDTLSGQFAGYVQAGIEEVKNLRKLDADVRSLIVAQLSNICICATLFC